MWGNRNLCTLMLGTQNRVTGVEHRMEAPQKVGLEVSREPLWQFWVSTAKTGIRIWKGISAPCSLQP